MAKQREPLFAGREKIEADEDAKFVGRTASEPIASLRTRRHARVTGVIISLVQSVPSVSPSLTVEVSDGSGVLTVTWLGRRAISGVMAGRYIQVDGMVDAGDGRPVMFNPSYSLAVAQ
ncbi:OB-fold nucleic acid binding domain-containing protein [Spelaeicoccus albus]|uniref:RecG-like helicase n=1 Tax=Spelaeicoccus albus TaxID=1280376 RepID=A0A7Z0II59_9MICO|nr:OB-fold nucleic acid binding domain-containing protein [Spelaeicoccus albus]NYI68164.1 RecG-like helicase [Spelaeicoccus albus]